LEVRFVSSCSVSETVPPGSAVLGCARTCITAREEAMSVFTRTAVVVGILALSYNASAQTDAQLGTWKLNLAKSKYAGGTAPKSSTLVVESANGGKGIKVTANIMLADGSPRTIAYTANCDGKDAAVTGTPDYNSVSMTCSGNTI